MDFNCRKMKPQDNYKLLISLVVPRPIALVTTVNGAGEVNAAPFSFFNAMGIDPPVVALGIENRPDESPKDTAINIRNNAEFVVNLVDEPLAERMNICAVDFPPETEEIAVAELETAPSIDVTPPRIVDAPASLECVRVGALELEAARQIFIGEVVRMHVRDGAVDPEDLHVDLDRLGQIGRLMGGGYCRTDDRFDMPRISYAEWRERNGG